MSHALLSASGASRWLVCTPSARLEEQFPDNAGEAAKEGTLAHDICETMLLERLGVISRELAEERIAGAVANPLYFDGMLDYCEDYATFVFGQFKDYQRKTPDTIIEIEVKLDFNEWVPEGFGTGDAVIITGGTLHIIDFKFGKGVPVSCEQNKQMMLYALGALYLYKWLYNITNVVMTVYQPRLENVSSWEVSAESLEIWAEIYLKPVATQAYNGEGDFTPGDHCRFCKAKNRCRGLAAFNQEVEKYCPGTSDTLTDDEIADILTRADMYVSWINSITDYAQDQAVNHGKHWPGFKLVEGRSVRTYLDETKVAQALLNNNIPRDAIYVEKLLGITAMEKAITKKKFDTLLSGLVIKPEGKPTLVPLSDKRPALNTAEKAAQAFADADLT